MSPLPPRWSRFVLVLLMVVALGAVYSSEAQSTPLTQIARTLDGQISIRMPQGWQSRDAAAPTLTSALAFGDSADSLQSIIDSLRGVVTVGGTRMNGAIGIFSPQLVAGLSSELAISSMLNGMISDVQLAGGQVVEQQSIMIGGLYPASIAVVSISGTAKGIIGVFQAGANIVQFQIGAAPERNFDANRQMFIDMMNSIRLPAETGAVVVVQPTAAIATAIPVQITPVNIDGAAVASPNSSFSLRLPQGWVNQSITIEGFGDVVAFGSDAASMTVVVDLIVNEQEPKTFEGAAGLIGVVDLTQLQGQTLDSLVTPLMQELITSIQAPGVQIVQQPQTHTFGGQYTGELAITNIGYIAAMRSDQQLLVALMLSSDVNADGDVINGMLESIRIPAEGGQQQVIPPTQAAPAPQPEPETVRSSDDHVSLAVPYGWTVLDHVADHSILAYGDSADAAQSRLASAMPDLASATAITGDGGLIILYTMERFSINPKNPDLAPLMERALGNLQGYTVEQAAQPLEGGGLFAVISGGERGFLALIPFEDEIAYVTATGTQSTFAASADLLFDIVRSVHVPALSESGLGGLGGLDSEAVTPEATAAGLGGL